MINKFKELVSYKGDGCGYFLILIIKKLRNKTKKDCKENEKRKGVWRFEVYHYLKILSYPRIDILWPSVLFLKYHAVRQIPFNYKYLLNIVYKW